MAEMDTEHFDMLFESDASDVLWTVQTSQFEEQLNTPYKLTLNLATDDIDADGCIPSCLVDHIGIQSDEVGFSHGHSRIGEPAGKQSPEVGGAHPGWRICVVDSDSHVCTTINILPCYIHS